MKKSFLLVVGALLLGSSAFANNYKKSAPQTENILTLQSIHTYTTRDVMWELLLQNKTQRTTSAPEVNYS